MKKRVLALLLALALLAFSACSEKAEDVSSADNESTITSQEESSSVSSAESTPSSSKTSETPAVSSEKPSSTPKPASSSTPAASSTPTPAVVNNYFDFDRIRINLPAGFKTISEEGTTLAVPNNYPAVSDNIAFVRSDTGDTLDNCTKEIINSEFKAAFGELFTGVTRYEVTKVGNKDAVIVAFPMTMSDPDSGLSITMKLTQIMIFDTTFADSIAFTSVTGIYDKDFDNCLKSITLR